MRTEWGLRGAALSVAAALMLTTTCNVANAGSTRRNPGVMAGAAIGAAILGGLAAAASAMQPAKPPKRQASSKPKTASGTAAMAEKLPSASEVAAIDASADPFGGAPSVASSGAMAVTTR